MRKIKKIKSFVNNHYYGLGFFVFLMAYLVIVPGDGKPWIVDDMSYSFYAVDFSVGFCSRILQGAIFNLFFDTVNATNISIYLSIILTTTFAVICFLAEKVVLSVDPKYRRSAIIIFLFFFIGTCTFSMHIKTVGIVDSFWLFAAALAFLCLQKKQMYFLVVPLFVFMIFIYYPALLCYVPFLAIILLYKISVTTEKREKKYLTAIFFISVISAVLFAFYFIIFERSNINYTIEEFHDLLADRGVKSGYFFYYDYAFYRYIEHFEENNQTTLPSFETGSSPLMAINVILQQMAITLHLIDFSYVTLLVFLLILPIVIYIYRFIIKEIRITKNNKLKRFAMVCMLLLFPATMFFGMCFSTDVVKWISNAFLPLFASFIYVLYKEKERVWEIIDKDIHSIHTSFLLPYFLVYGFTLFFPDMS